MVFSLFDIRPLSSARKPIPHFDLKNTAWFLVSMELLSTI